MIDRLREIPQRILEWWNKFTTKQKTIIISVAAGVVVALAVLATILTRPVYETLITCESPKQASEIISLLEGDGIPYRVTDDGLIISVLKENIASATLLLGANSIPADVLAEYVRRKGSVSSVFRIRPGGKGRRSVLRGR